MPSAVAYRTSTATAGGVPLVAATAKTVLNVISPAGHGLAFTEISVTFDGAISTAAPAFVEICQSTQGVAGTSVTAVTPVQVRGRSSGGQAPTAGSNYSAEPTALTAIWGDFVPVFNGFVLIQYGTGNELEIDSSAGTVKALALRITAPAGVNARVVMECCNL